MHGIGSLVAQYGFFASLSSGLQAGYSSTGVSSRSALSPPNYSVKWTAAVRLRYLRTHRGSGHLPQTLALMGLLRLLAICAGICLFWLPGVATSQSAYGTLSFSPEAPTTNDSITAILTPAAGEPNWCSLSSSVSGNNVVVIANAFDCPPGIGTQNAAALGKLPAGTYTVTWTFPDNFFDVPVPTATLTVATAAVPAPTLSVFGVVALALVLYLSTYLTLRLSRLGRHER